MTSSILVVVVAVCVVASVSAQSSGKMSCQDGHGTGFYPNKFIYTPDAYDGSASYVDTNVGVGQSGTFGTTNTFGDLGNAFRVYDNGILAEGTPVAAINIATYSGSAGTLTDQAFISAVSYPPADLFAAEVECKVISRTAEISGSDLVGGRICYLERMAEDILAWDWAKTHTPDVTAANTIQPIQVDEMIVCTWAMTGNDQDLTLPDDGTMYAQVAIGYTSDGETYASMFYELQGTAFNTPYTFLYNGDYANAGNTEYAVVCGAQTLGVNSNLFCGKPGQVIFSLNDADLCGAGAAGDSCAALETDLWSRNPNCNDLRAPADTCYAEGKCTYTYNQADTSETEFEFTFADEIVSLNRWEAVRSDNMQNTVGGQCDLTGDADVGANGDVTITKTWGATGIALCSQSGSFGNTYTFLLHNFDSNEAMAGPPSMNGNHVWKMGSRQYRVTCRPADLPTQASIGVTVAGDVHETTVPTSIPSLTLQFGNKLNYKEAGFATFGDGDMVGLGRPLYPYLCYTPGANWVVNVNPYGVRGITCRIADTAAFDNKVKTVLSGGCTNDALTAFKADEEFVSRETSVTTGGTFCATMGAIRAARWVTQNEIWLECTVDFCTNTGYYLSSYCKNSCPNIVTPNGYDAPGNRKKRQAEDEEPVRVVTHIRISDTTEDDAQMSCADPTMAISAIVALVVLLLVATVIAVFLMLKMQSRRRKC